MAKAKKNKVSAEATDPSTKTSVQPSTAPAFVNAPTADQSTTVSVFAKDTAKSSDITKVGSLDFHGFISDLVPSLAANPGHVPNTTGPQSEVTLLGKEAITETAGMKKTSFVGLFNNNRKLTDDNKLMKFVVDGGALKLESNDLIDVETKLGYCLVGYNTGKFPGLKAIRALAQSWGASFQQHDSGWLIFKFAREKDKQCILAGGPCFVYGRPLLLKNMSDCFEFKEDDVSLTPVWAILPSLPLECWHPNALGKIGSRLGTPIAMDSLTMR
ncbi:hypothetical protein Salat_2928500 [Sesamum alatum]|uniref:DUF4283 domain-containing protein n=1 Tax=Sesamum alatum TaxID=300844 RepID=A0AAE1XJY3_9LAMI|nr:hypothetical protein Salat_2928500 [Sesamum alatum]